MNRPKDSFLGVGLEGNDPPTTVTKRLVRASPAIPRQPSDPALRLTTEEFKPLNSMKICIDGTKLPNSHCDSIWSSQCKKVTVLLNLLIAYSGDFFFIFHLLRRPDIIALRIIDVKSFQEFQCFFVLYILSYCLFAKTANDFRHGTHN